MAATRVGILYFTGLERGQMGVVIYIRWRHRYSQGQLHSGWSCCEWSRR